MRAHDHVQTCADRHAGSLNAHPTNRESRRQKRIFTTVSRAHARSPGEMRKRIEPIIGLDRHSLEKPFDCFIRLERGRLGTVEP
jgi:hypothetical protein